MVSLNYYHSEMKSQVGRLLKSLVKINQSPSKPGKRIKNVNKEIKTVTYQIISYFDEVIKKLNISRCKLCKECDCQKINSDDRSLAPTDIDQTTQYFKEDINYFNETNAVFTDITMQELIGPDYNNDYNPILNLPKLDVELLEFNKDIKYSKYFNSKLLFQKYTPTEGTIPYIKKEFGWAFIYNSKLIMKLFINIKNSNYIILIKCRNKRFKNIQGFDYFSDITYNELFFLSIIKYIVFLNRKDNIGLFQYFLTSLQIYNNKNLFSISDYNCTINPAINLEAFKIINLRHYYLREDALEFISEGLYYSKNVIEIILEENKVGDRGIFLLSKALKSPMINLKTLGLSYNVISDEGAKYIADALMVNKSIKAIGLYNNNIGNYGSQALGEMFKYNNTLESINLSKNLIYYDGLKSLLDGLAINTKLKVIGLEFLNITDDGAKIIKNLLQNNNTIEGINLSNNSIGDEGFISICEGLSQNTKLTTLSIRRNHISNEGSICFSNMILINSTIKLVYLQENSIRNDGARYILNSIKVNSTVSEIYLYENCIQHDLKTLIRADEKRIKI